MNNTTDIPTPSLGQSGRTTSVNKAFYEVSGGSENGQKSDLKRTARRAARWFLRDEAQKITTLLRLTYCGRRATKLDPEIKVKTAKNGHPVAHYANVQLCGLVWACPVCGPRIRSARAAEINIGLSRWIAAHGPGSVALVTLTLPHFAHERLGPLLSLTSDAFARITQGKSWAALRKEFLLVGYIRAHDTTHGANGWHPHLHLVFLAEKALSIRDAEKLRKRLFSLWSAAIVARGHRAPTLRACSVEVARNASAVSVYVAQVTAGSEQGGVVPVALEVARGDLKSARKTGQRTPWEILSDATDFVVPFSLSFEKAAAFRRKKKRDIALWNEWEQATKGIHSIQWSRGLRALIAMTDEKSDAEIVEEEIGGSVIYKFEDRNNWRAVVARSGARLLLLRVAERFNAEGIARMVRWIAAGFAPILAEEAEDERRWARSHLRGRTIRTKGGYIWMPAPPLRVSGRARRAIRSVLLPTVRAEIRTLMAA